MFRKMKAKYNTSNSKEELGNLDVPITELVRQMPHEVCYSKPSL